MVGRDEGRVDGLVDGRVEGRAVGREEGRKTGAFVGLGIGAFVGLGVGKPIMYVGAIDNLNNKISYEKLFIRLRKFIHLQLELQLAK